MFSWREFSNAASLRTWAAKTVRDPILTTKFLMICVQTSAQHVIGDHVGTRHKRFDLKTVAQLVDLEVLRVAAEGLDPAALSEEERQARSLCLTSLASAPSGPVAPRRRRKALAHPSEPGAKPRRRGTSSP